MIARLSAKVGKIKSSGRVIAPYMRTGASGSLKIRWAGVEVEITTPHGYGLWAPREVRRRKGRVTVTHAST